MNSLICAITSFFNPFNSIVRTQNFLAFATHLAKQRVPLITVESLLPGQISLLPPAISRHTVISDVLIWQKECLLNVAIAALPDECRYVAWIDADIIFDDHEWAAETISLLDAYPVVQLFSQVSMLERGEVTATEGSIDLPSFASQLSLRPELASASFDAHGHTGFAWAMRRDELCHIRLFDGCIVGGSDHVMAHAFAGNPLSQCVSRLLGSHTSLHRYYCRWSGLVRDTFSLGLGVRNGRICHLWHGSLESRRYLRRNSDLTALGFDLDCDLSRDASGLWSWKDERSAVAEYVKSYILHRHEGES